MIFGILLGVLAAVGCTRRETAPRPGTFRSLSTAAVESRKLSDRIEVDGVVIGLSEAVVSSRLAASVAEVAAIPGRSVRSGTVLVRLEEKETDGALEGARAALLASRSALDLARRNRARYEKLEGRQAAAAVELERVRQDEAAAAAAVAAAEAALRRAETDRAQTVLTAPFDAVVVEKWVSPGDLAAPGRPLVRVASIAGRRVEAAPGEDQASRLEEGEPLEVVVGGRTWTGRVAEIVGAVDSATRRRTVRVDLPAGVDPPVGSFARLLLPGPKEERLVAPARAVVARGGLEIVWAVSPEGRVDLRYVRTGAARDGLVELRSGVRVGERVVLDPPADLEAGTRIRS
jgi:RND family efflux transporter MFP subunit